MMVVVVLILSIVVVAVGWLWQRGARLRAMGEKLPGPRAYPLVGNALQLGTTTSEFLSNLERIAKDFHGVPFRIWIGPDQLFVIVKDPKDVEIILSSNKWIDKGDFYKFMLPWLGTGLLISTDTKWRKHRKILTPTFHFKILEDFVDVFNANGKIMIEKLKSRVDGPAFDIYNYITLCALDIICETALGVKIDAQSNAESEYVKAIRDESDIVMQRSFKPWLSPDILFNLTSLKALHEKSLKILHDTTNAVIKSRRAEFVKEKASQGDVKKEDDGVKKRLALLDMLIESTYEGSGLTDEEIREEVDTFMFEGHDTTASGTSFALWILSWHQDVQDKVYNELLEVCPDKDAEMSHRNLQDLKYLDRVIKESQRMYPTISFFARQLQQDVTLSQGHVAPKGCTVMIANFLAAKNADIFPDPYKFDPDRFLPDNVQGMNPYSFVPFSAGPRNCIGQKFAIFEMKSGIAHMLRSYKLLPGSEKPDLIPAADLILVSHSGIKVKIVART